MEVSFMGMGAKIKELRYKKGITQKDLAEKLNVSFQAVSRWENDEVEPSIDTIKQMASIFECSIDELFGMNEKEETKEKEPEVKVIERVIVQESKPVLATCERCNKPIYDPDDIVRFDKVIHKGGGRYHHTETIKMLYCASCNQIRLEELRKEEERKKALRDKQMANRRKHSFIWPTLLALIFLVISIELFSKGKTGWGVFLLIDTFLSFTFLACIILDNNIVGEVWVSIATWSIKLPGVIFTLDLEGIFFLITVKILGAILSLALSIVAIIVATLIGFAISIFSYPFAISKNVRGIE